MFLRTGQFEDASSAEGRAINFSTLQETAWHLTTIIKEPYHHNFLLFILLFHQENMFVISYHRIGIIHRFKL